MKLRLLSPPLLLLLCGALRSQGLIIRPDFQPAGLELCRHAITAQLDEQIAVVTVAYEFYNPGPTAVEGTFLFPLPANAQISRFRMDAEGREMAGELLGAEEALRIYEDIVRRQLDPALLEMVNHRSFRARLFPIPAGATRKLTLRYDAPLNREGNTVTFQYPLQGNLTHRGAGSPRPEPLPRPDMRIPLEHTGQPEHMQARQSTLQLELQAETALRNIYSPSHRIVIHQQSERRATVTSEVHAAQDARDFLLYYSLDPNEIAATLLTHRPESDRPGYFMLLLSPQIRLAKDQILARDLVFVLDTSGSMAGEKIAQAKAALRYCLQRLGERDRFGLVTFSSEVRLFRPALAEASARDDALWHLDRLEATGGTDINAALRAAHQLLRESDAGRGMIIFLTDGLPSTGVQDEGQIRRNLQHANRNDVRLFSFGVGFDVNTRLLDGLSHDHHAFADYITPQENIEERVARFYEKVRYPVMSNLSCEFRGADVRFLSPRHLPDLFKGGQIILTGRYHEAGHASLTLRGRVGEQRQTLQYEFDFPPRERQREFVARLWATRRVGDLLEEIRLNGESAELTNEVISLAKEFGLVTPYTSYLVREEEQVISPTVPLGRLRSREKPSAPAPSDQMLMPAVSGADAVFMSKAIREMQEAAVVMANGHVHVTVIQGRTMIQQAGGLWVDEEFKPALATVKLPFASTSYFTFLRLFPQAGEFCRLGRKVIFKWRETFVEIGEQGEPELGEIALRRTG
ncbi:MAG: VIT and VWA domain-containing protein [candidate division KSB1 bacterium]|nr:VIT and VWA domain-containing protein [candidate division KSB1 bacterium]MDZ7272976.1 VIT and VWA domain-containing protein [candidate division KSB1 bacterium]MDZ7285080.1 VIT and VWA domain-containing protein [candidate division KSB1 bacterium]MDZ7298112.1 VIT and VWA domain-containing protein [candidate division KSB1 bacterium]MDZ7308211.1 VIT and VWA domain-containing protein [candidate division KSB1 bacterium]